jgi:plasmid replication initiation protein
MDLVILDEKSQIKKSEALVKSRYKLKPLALKLITALISSVQNTDKPDKTYFITVKQFTALAELKGNDYYHQLDEATTDIMKNTLIIPKNGKGFIKANWCSSIEYVENEAVIKFQISPKIFPYILDVKEKYLRYDLKNIILLKSEYSIRIYEWLKDEYNTYKRYNRSAEIILEVNLLRDRFEIPTSYQWVHIKERILNKAQKDLMSRCDIKFDWEVYAKSGKKTTHIKFNIYPNSKNIKENNKLPIFLSGYMNYVNYLRNKYKGNAKHFFLIVYEINDDKQLYYFGINNDNLVYATSFKGGNSINISSKQAEVILNASYLCATHSKIYRNLISDSINFWELSKDEEHKEFFKVVKNEIITTLSKFDARVKPLF